MIQIVSKSGMRRDQKILLSNITRQFLENKIHVDRAEISGKEISMNCGDEKKALEILKATHGIEKIIFREKEIMGRGGLPAGSRGNVLLDAKKYKKFARRMGFEIVQEDFDAVVTNNIRKFKKKGFLALDFSYCSIL